jgi:hypothetical protein
MVTEAASLARRVAWNADRRRRAYSIAASAKSAAMIAELRSGLGERDFRFATGNEMEGERSNPFPSTIELINLA